MPPCESSFNRSVVNEFCRDSFPISPRSTLAYLFDEYPKSGLAKIDSVKFGKSDITRTLVRFCFLLLKGIPRPLGGAPPMPAFIARGLGGALLLRREVMLIISKFSSNTAGDGP
jgi:hypothetical protein